ncbi:MAG: hypothetical protein A2694_04495 [Candidatus Blackburnbacteria bacterium RIFCSPHIGHO2_01_FULL_40_17]|uniref:Homing endonuclease LAGLIDADG domain-containing protein n=1 Tax=Candidatus Blackburnbacteria bacterium RIFCSPLOWO2_01_FULL_40_20 TaxID=1797519 RepID=A0A1G1VFQ5_9BACT|nr:MAG: hypothetical protein A2694_04495 [Candidatus Blackburnbacteria bacterium RIFCSPHIGHO2_01_FULL_40_17]OGY14209.1 MAG: hypothetical protein A3A77_01880 [Candidatus Blackburnbacteria bacterium RIFCSPLOWO2_01_FULL_40_20]HBL52002.1 hypothetical protein [Candidatus Blackburnbacteria bacterium]
MLSPDYIVGLTDGEGCFYVGIRPPDKRYSRSKHGVMTHFYIKMREDELSLLKKVEEFFGCGAVYHQKEKRRNHSQCYRYEINSQEDIRKVLIPFFDAHHLQSVKVENYKIFRKIALLVRDKRHNNKRGLKLVLQLKSRMNLGSRPVREIRSPGGNATKTLLDRNPPVR